MQPRIKHFFLAYFLAWATLGFTATHPDIVPLDDGPVHEAFAEPVTGVQVLTALPEAPPSPIREKRPFSNDPELQWVRGYWAFSQKRGDYVWVSGVLRLRPPGHRWVHGNWMRLEEGWVWLHGFWAAEAVESFTYIEQAPPDDLEEEVGKAPSDEYFWVPGYWEHREETGRYEWLRGVWERFDPNWVLVPAHYVWRPDGYIFIPAYWDHPIEKRGKLYKPVVIPAPIRRNLDYTPCCIWEPDLVCRHLFLWYPNYVCFIHHCWHYHPGWWHGCNCIPTWWHWNNWWCFNWHNHWALWWWWSHPGFAHPLWMNPFLASHIAPPGNWTLSAFSSLNAPLFITPYGVVSPHALLQALHKMGVKQPIIADKKQALDMLQDLAAESQGLEEEEPLLPTGKEQEEGADLEKPADGRGQEKGPTVTVPPKDGWAPPRVEIDKQIEEQIIPERPEIQVIPPLRRPRIEIEIDKPPPRRYPRPYDEYYPPRRPRPPRPRPHDDEQHTPRPRPRPRWPFPGWPPTVKPEEQDQDRVPNYPSPDEQNRTPPRRRFPRRRQNGQGSQQRRTRLQQEVYEQRRPYTPYQQRHPRFQEKRREQGRGGNRQSETEALWYLR